MFLSCVFCLTILILINLVISTFRKKNEEKSPPTYSRSLPIIGATHLLLTDTVKLWDTVKTLAKEAVRRGGIVKTKLGLDTYHIITDPEKAAIVANECLDKIDIYKYVECWFGKALITAPVPTWKQHRKLLSPAFSLQIIHGFVDVFNDQARQLIKDMDDKVGKGSFEATSIILKNFLRGACSTTFGTNNIPDEEIFEKYINAVNDLVHLLTERCLKFWLHSDLVYKLSGIKKKEDELVKSLTAISDGILQKACNMKKEQSSNDDSQTVVKSFLDMYLQLNTNNVLTMKELREELELTIAAAFDMTAIEFESILIYLGSHLDVQERVFQEIKREIGEEQDVNTQDLQRLVYTEAVIKETLRIAPVAPIIARHIDKDVELSDCTLRQGTQAVIMLYNINRDSSWGPDADQFRPERWLEPGGVPNIASAFASFSIGKRSCVGKKYAITSLKVILVHILRKYEIEAACTKVQYKLDVLLKPVKGHEISLKARDIK